MPFFSLIIIYNHVTHTGYLSIINSKVNMYDIKYYRDIIYYNTVKDNIGIIIIINFNV